MVLTEKQVLSDLIDYIDKLKDKQDVVNKVNLEMTLSYLKKIIPKFLENR